MDERTKNIERIKKYYNSAINEMIEELEKCKIDDFISGGSIKVIKDIIDSVTTHKKDNALANLDLLFNSHINYLESRLGEIDYNKRKESN